MAENTEQVSFDPASNHPHLEVPEIFLLPARRRILHMMPGDMSFVSSASIVIDGATNRLLIDTNDHLPPPLRHVTERLSRPAVLRVMRLVGKKAYDGYLIDHRHVETPLIKPRTGTYGEQPEEGEEWTLHKTQNPLGALFRDEENVGYIGLDGLEETAHFFAAGVDAYLETLRTGNGHEKAMLSFDDYFTVNENVLK